MAAAEAAARDDMPTLLPLTSVQVVLRSSPASRVAALPRVVAAISDFLDYAFPQFWSLLRACEANLQSLLPVSLHGGYLLVSTRTTGSVGAAKGWCSLGWQSATGVRGGGRMDHERAVSEVLSNRRIDVAKFLYDHPQQHLVDWELGICCAAEQGDLEMVQCLCSKLNASIPSTKYKPIDYAAYGGHLHVVQWLHVHYPTGCSRDAMKLAASHGHLTVYKWLHENRTESCTTHAMNWAAANGHLEIVEWLHVNRLE